MIELCIQLIWLIPSQSISLVTWVFYMEGKVLAFLPFFSTGKIISSLPSLAINPRQAHGPSSPQPYTEALINPDSLQPCLLFPPSPPHPSHCPSPSPGSPCPGSSSAPISVPQLLLQQKEATLRQVLCVQTTDLCLAGLAQEPAKLPWQSLPKAEEIFGFIVSTEPLIFMQLGLSQLSARSFLSLKLAKRFKLFLRRG